MARRSVAPRTLLAALAGATTRTRRLFAAEPRGIPVAREPWGRLERVADGVWMLISTPARRRPRDRAMRTFSNGGLVAGRDGVLAIEGFASEEGAGWLAGEARRLTGRWPSHVVLTHCHGDHSAGLGGYGAGGARVEILGTAVTRDLLRQRRPEAVLPTTHRPRLGPNRARPGRPARPDRSARRAHRRAT